MTLETLGWSELRQEKFQPYAADGLVPGRVMGEHRTHFQVATHLTELSAEATGRLRKSAAQRSDLPGVGDFVAIRLSPDDGPASIEAVLPRTSALVRKAASERRPQLLAANVDAVFIVTAPDGDFNLPRLERYLRLVEESGADPVIIVNKSDLTENAASFIDQIAAIAPGIAMHAISARGESGMDVLEAYFEGNRTIVLVGSSGVGKSTLTNRLMGQSLQATQEVRAHDSRGRHTTTHRQLFVRPHGGAIIDTPGIRGLELWNAAPEVETIPDHIAELALQCRFRNCRHQSEPGCAVRAAIENGTIQADAVSK
ncbi:ribosome small subunit-dependent GTPase A [Hyphomicrobium sp.]|uniref:ribosome small subunit-dependent GTPase A n=1 Tax=Hyphomicrobium sp. TaxID=82 RepID=UPI003F7148AA